MQLEQIDCWLNTTRKERGLNGLTVKFENSLKKAMANGLNFFLSFLNEHVMPEF